MGHWLFGKLPRTRRWREVIDLMASAPEETEELARATVWAANNKLQELENDPSIGYCFWLLTRTMQAAREEDFPTALSRLGLEISAETPTLAFISQLSDQARRQLSDYPQSGHFGEIAQLALRRALTETIGQRRSLLGSSVEDLRAVLKIYSTRTRFAGLAQLFFGDLLARTMTGLLDRELANCLHSTSERSALDRNEAVIAAIDLHARQTALVMREFAGDWYSKHNWESQRQITRDETQRFVAHALDKLRGDLLTEAV